MPDLLESIPNSLDRQRAKQLRDYVRTELANSRTPHKKAVATLNRYNDLARENGGSPPETRLEADAQEIRNSVTDGMMSKKLGALHNAKDAERDTLGLSNAKKAQTSPTPTYDGKPVDGDTLNIIRESAEANAHITECEIKGLRPDPRAIRRIQEIESMARSRLSPDQYEAALAHMHGIKSEIMDQNRQQEVVDGRTAVDNAEADAQKRSSSAMANALRDVSAGMSVDLETPADLEAFRAGEPVKQRTGKTSFDKDKINKGLHERYGMDLDKFKTTMEEIIETERTNPDKADEQREKLGITKVETDLWDEDTALRLGLTEKMAAADKDEDEYEDVEPNEDDVRHLDVAEALAENGETMTDSLHQFKEKNEELLQGEGLHSDVARAFASVEENQ